MLERSITGSYNAHGSSTSSWRLSEVEAFRDIPLLAIERLLLGLDEVVLRDLHPSLTQREEARLSTHGLDVRATQLVLGSVVGE